MNPFESLFLNKECSIVSKYRFSQKQICKVRQGLGIATNNAAEYHALILGLRHAIEKGYKKIKVKGDSKLVCMQVCQ